MGKVVIRCKKCGNDKWEDTIPQKHLQDKHCGKCGAVYCAKNRECIYEEN